MGLKDQLRQNAAASQQATCTPSGCKACQRQGLPIFPLRVAAVPKALVNSGWQPAVPQQDIELTGGEFKYALRTLRMGYLYVLLDKTIWQGYQVTAEGYLRQFNPLAMPEGETVEPLSTACLTHGHDIAASFINIDDTKYQVAWLAFSSDPWSEAVLAEYKSGQRPASRFTQIVLSELKASPASIPEALALNPSLSALKSHVAEFATNFFSNTEKVAGESLGGAHGFYPRLDSEMALGLRIAQLGAQYRCQIAALALDDTVGVVQELNNSRMQIVEARQVYNERQDIRHQHMVSDAIEQYLASLKTVIENNSQPQYEHSASTYPIADYKVIPKEEVAKWTYADKVARLQEYYNEPSRAAFAVGYKRILEGYQQRLETIGKDLACWYDSKSWQDVVSSDYAPETCPAGWAAQLSTVATCLQGGCTDDSTEKVWLKWLQDPSSPAYGGILGNQKSAFEAIYMGTGGYTNLKAVLNAKEVADWIDSERVRRAVALRMLAMSGAVTRLSAKLEQGVLDAYNRVTQGQIFLMTQKQVTVFTVTMTVKEYQQLHRDIARVQLTAHGKPAEFGGELRSAKKVKRTASAGSLSQITDPIILKQRLAVTMIADAAPEEFIASLDRGSLKDIQKINGLSELRISEVTLDGAASRAPIKLMPKQLQSIIDGQLQLSRRLVSGNMLGGMLGFGMLLLQARALPDNMKAVQETVTGVNAQLALLSNMTMVASSSVETCGFIHMLVRSNPWDLAPNVKGVLAYAHPLLRAGGAIAGISSIIDGIGMLVKASAANNAGGADAAKWYFAAGVSTIAGGGLFLYSAYACQFAFFGPVGLAALLIVAGAAMVIQAEKAISSAFEVWLRCCCFGVEEKRGKNDPVWSIYSAEDLYDTMMAYTVTVSGMTAEVDYQDLIGEIGNNEDLIKMRIRLPDCNSTQSAWDLKLVAQDKDETSQLLVSQYGLAGTTDTASSITEDGSFLLRNPRHPDYPLNNTLAQSWDDRGLILDGVAWVNSSRFQQAVLSVNYWPDKSDPESLMTLSMTVND